MEVTSSAALYTINERDSDDNGVGHAARVHGIILTYERTKWTIILMTVGIIINDDEAISGSEANRL